MRDIKELGLEPLEDLELVLTNGGSDFGNWLIDTIGHVVCAIRSTDWGFGDPYDGYSDHARNYYQSR